jgi:predicted Zn-dependent protease
VASILLTAALACAGCRFLESRSTNHVQTDWDNPAVGQMAMRMYLRAHPPSRQPQQKQLLEQVGARLAAAANRPGYDWHFELVDDSQPDIAVFPAGNVAVTEGMIAACRNEAEFAAALAHELSHMLARHPMQQAMPDITGRSEEPGPYQRRRDPQDEIEADSIALSLLARAGYEPQALLSFWQHADANPERIAFIDGHADHSRQLVRLDSALAQAQQIYRANPQKQGLGIQIVRDESSRSQQPTPAMPTATHGPEIRWTAAADRTGPSDPRGAAKPPGWNADLVDEGDWMLPVEEGVQQAGFEWSPAGASR